MLFQVAASVQTTAQSHMQKGKKKKVKKKKNQKHSSLAQK